MSGDYGAPATHAALRNELGDVAHPRFLGDAIVGDGTLFAGQNAVEAAWAVVQPVLGLVTPAHDYEFRTWGRSAAENLTAGICGCHSPVWLLPHGKNGESR